MNVFRVLHTKILANRYLSKHYRLPTHPNYLRGADHPGMPYWVMLQSEGFVMHLAMDSEAYTNIRAGDKAPKFERQGFTFL